MPANQPSTPGEWASHYRQEWKAVRRSRSELEALLANIKRRITEWDAVVAMERCPKGYRQMIVAVDGVPADHDHWWSARQRPQLRGELADLRLVEGKLEKEIRKLGTEA
jgi:hypothetical protein